MDQPFPPARSPRALELAEPRAPRPMRLANRVTRPAARRIWPLTPEALVRSACRTAGLREFGRDAPLDEPLAVLCDSLNAELDLHPIGRAAMTRLVTTSLVNRLRLQDLRRRQPEVFRQPVPAPIVITGPPRSGTTFLHRLLSRHPALYAAPFWELWQPFAPPKPTRGDPARRVAAGRRAVTASNWIAPDTAAIHDLRYQEPDEEIIAMAPAFGSIMFEWSLGVPAFAAWYRSTDQTPAYRYLRLVLQAMQSHRRPGGRWVLKAPQHLEQLTALLRVFPDATVIHTRRDPVPVVASLADYIAYSARIYLDRPDPNAIGRRSADMVERLLRAAVRDRDPADPRHLDVSFTRLRRDPEGVLRHTGAVTGLELDPDTLRGVYAWLAEQRAAARPVRSCSATDFGLDPGALGERFAFYRYEDPA